MQTTMMVKQPSTSSAGVGLSVEQRCVGEGGEVMGVAVDVTIPTGDLAPAQLQRLHDSTTPQVRLEPWVY